MMGSQALRGTGAHSQLAGAGLPQERIDAPPLTIGLPLAQNRSQEVNFLFCTCPRRSLSQ